MPIYGPQHPIWDNEPSKRHCGVVCNVWEAKLGNQTKEIDLELTLSLRRDEKQYLHSVYCKILKGIDSRYKIINHAGFYEIGGVNNHRHIHAKITISLPLVGSHPGLIEELARLICIIIRRKYDDKHMYHTLEKYYSVPFVLQINTRDSWDQYIRKQNLNALESEKIIF